MGDTRMTETIEDLSDQTFDPHTADDEMYGNEEDPYAALRQMRAKGSVLTLDATEGNRTAAMAAGRYDRSFIALSHEAVEQVLNDASVFSNSPFESSLGVTFGRTL